MSESSTPLPVLPPPALARPESPEDDAALPAGIARAGLVPRTLACVLGAVAIGGPLALYDAPVALWVLLAVQTIAWPLAARWLTDRAQARGELPIEAELRNMVLDGAFSASWLAALHFEPLNVIAIVGVPWLNAVGVGGPPLLLRTVRGQVVGAAAGIAAMGLHFARSGGLVPLASAAPLLIVYPLLLAHLHQRLLAQLAERKRALRRSERVHRETLDAMQSGLVLWDAQDRLVLCNAEYRRQHAGIAHLLVPGAPFESLLRALVEGGHVPQARGREDAWVRERLAQHHRPQQPVERDLPDGRTALVTQQRLADGRLLAFAIDVTPLVEARRALAQARTEAERARSRLEDAIEALPDAFAMYDAEDRLQAWNSTYLRAYKESAFAAHAGMTFEALLRAGLACGQYPDAIGREEAWLAERLAHHREPSGPFLQQLPGDRWMRVNERRTREGGCAGTRTDVTDLVRREHEVQSLLAQRDAYATRLRQAHEQLEQLTTVDAATGAAHRRLLERRIDEEWRRAQRHRTSLALLLVALAPDDGASAGDPQGDLLNERLRQVATQLRATARRAGELVARWDARTCAVLLPDADAERAGQVASQARERLAEAAAAGALGVSVGVGVAVADFDAGDTPPAGHAAATLAARAMASMATTAGPGNDAAGPAVPPPA